MTQKNLEIWVGVFVLASFLAFLILAFQVSGLSMSFRQVHYDVTANFDNIGGLKTRAPVKIAGVEVGEVSTIQFNPDSFKAVVTLTLKARRLPRDSAAYILTQGLLGSNYIALKPGFSPEFLKNGDLLLETHSALVLENLIGQFLFSLKTESTRS